MVYPRATLCTKIKCPLNLWWCFQVIEIKNFKSKSHFDQLFATPLPRNLCEQVINEFTLHLILMPLYWWDNSQSTRIKDHTHSDKNSFIYKLLHTSPQCKTKNLSCFRILGTANSSFTLKHKEVLYIKKLKPNLNKQIHQIGMIFNL